MFRTAFIFSFVFLFLNIGFTEEAKKTKIGSIEDGKKAISALKDIFQAYGNGDVNYIRERLDSSMIGYQNILDGIVVENNQCKQMRLRLLDTQVQAAPNLVVIQSGWEKRCLQLPTMTPKLFTGQATFLMHLGSQGWGIAGITGTNPLSPNVPVR